MASDKTIYDTLGSAPDGMNSGIDPLLLPKTQFAFALNGTFRGDFFRQRPPYQTIALFYQDKKTSLNFQTGQFQGAGYYKPDYGSESIGMAIAGRLFLFTPNTQGGATITDITPANDPNPSNQSQAWLEQAENFLIWNDGLSLPVFYDGANSRRSLGQSQLLGTVSTNPPGGAIVPPVGGTVQLILNAPYSGPMNETIYIDGATYVVTQNGGSLTSYGLTLENLSDTAGSSVPASSNLVVEPDNYGNIVSISLVGYKQSGGSQIPYYDIVLTAPAPANIAPNVNIHGQTWSVLSASGSEVYIWYPSFSQPPLPSVGQNVVAQNGTGTNVTVGTLLNSFTVPAVGQTVNVTLSTGYTGAVGQVLFIGTGQYKVTALANVTPAASNIITVENLTDTPGNFIPDGTTKDINGNTIPAATLNSLPELPAGRQ